MSAVREARVTAQAKVNLSLRVLAREASGYHQLETLFCRLSLGDDVRVRAAPNGRRLSLEGDALPPGGLGPVESNLAWRAAEAYQRRAGWPAGVAFAITKRIPDGGGLGGGSADAGAVLRCLNALNPDPMHDAALLVIAGTLGADVPFVTQAVSPLALAWGRGERLLPLPSLRPAQAWLFCPDFGVPTADAYRWLDESPPAHEAALIDPASLSTWEGVSAIAGNDFESVVGARYPKIGSILEGLRSPAMRAVFGRAPLVQLSGTGSTVFAIRTELPTTAGDAPRQWRSDEPGVRVLTTTCAERVEPVSLSD